MDPLTLRAARPVPPEAGADGHRVEVEPEVEWYIKWF